MARPVFLQKLTLYNFRSVQNAVITFGNPLFLVGRNGSGKSNLLDAIAFLTDCMDRPLVSAIERRGGLSRLFYVGAKTLRIRADLELNGEPKSHGFYAFEVAVPDGGAISVVREQCRVVGPDRKTWWFDRYQQSFDSNVEGIKPFLNAQSLALPLVGGTEAFAPVVQELSTMRVYAIDPVAIRELPEFVGGTTLRRDGSNVADVLHHLESNDKGALNRVAERLSLIVPGITKISPAELRTGGYAPLFTQEWVNGSKTVFDATGMSDGTLRALGLIVASMQEPAPTLLAIEEPEATLHPGALNAIADLIQLAALRSQVVVTTHSPELLDAKWIQPVNIRIVAWENAATRVSELGVAPVKALQQHLMGTGELLRADALDAADHTLTPELDPFEGLAA